MRRKKSLTLVMSRIQDEEKVHVSLTRLVGGGRCGTREGLAYEARTVGQGPDRNRTARG